VTAGVASPVIQSTFHIERLSRLGGPEIRAEHLIADVMSRHTPLH
jgi:hypothetical protein